MFDKVERLVVAAAREEMFEPGMNPALQSGVRGENRLGNRFQLFEVGIRISVPKDGVGDDVEALAEKGGEFLKLGAIDSRIHPSP